VVPRSPPHGVHLRHHRSGGAVLRGSSRGSHLCREHFEARRITVAPAGTTVAALQQAERRSAALRDAPYRAFVKPECPIVSAADQDKQRSR
jgi:hypothetical protein